MKHFLLVVLLSPTLIFAQNNRKQKKAEAKQKIEIITNLKSHIQFLASDSLEGRRTGTKGELKAANYLVNQYKIIGLEPGNAKEYLQEFEFNEGKSYIENSSCSINDVKLKPDTDFFPLSYSSSNKISTNSAVALKENAGIWFLNVKDVLEENKSNPHFDIDEYLKNYVDKIHKNGCTGLILYNSSSIIDNISFNKKDKSTALPIPVVYINYKTYLNHIKDELTSYDLAINIDIDEAKRKVRNVVGFINNQAQHTVILGAHYDHLGFGEDKNALDILEDIHNGADDNASGSAALLELAKLLKNSKFKENNYLIMHFSGEELGLIGSKHWLENPTINISKNYMINMDMVGRYDTSHKLTVGGFGTSPIWGNVIPNISTPLIVKYDSIGSGPSDHASFYRKDLPVLFFFTGSHSDYHKTTDDFDKINYENEADIVRLIYNIIGATNTKGKLQFTKTNEPSMGKSSRFTVSLGVIPDYGFSGTGVRIDGVSPGKLAEKTGLKTFDILLQLGDYKFTDVMSYMTTLSKFKKGDSTKLVIKRGEEELSFDIIF